MERPSGINLLIEKLKSDIVCEYPTDLAQATTIAIVIYSSFRDFITYPSKNEGWTVFAPTKDKEVVE